MQLQQDDGYCTCMLHFSIMKYWCSYNSLVSPPVKLKVLFGEHIADLITKIPAAASRRTITVRHRQDKGPDTEGRKKRVTLTFHSIAQCTISQADVSPHYLQTQIVNI